MMWVLQHKFTRAVTSLISHLEPYFITSSLFESDFKILAREPDKYFLASAFPGLFKHISACSSLSSPFEPCPAFRAYSSLSSPSSLSSLFKSFKHFRAFRAFSSLSSLFELFLAFSSLRIISPVFKYSYPF